MNILIVEDEATSREMLLNILKSEGDHRILTASDGDEALKLMADPRHPFDVVFLDLMLPSISGLDLLERVRATPACRYVRVIICTTSTDSATVVRAARLGVRHYMVKPPDKIRVVEQLNIIKAEIAGLQKIEKPEETASRLGIDRLTAIRRGDLQGSPPSHRFRCPNAQRAGGGFRDRIRRQNRGIGREPSPHVHRTGDG